MLKIIIKNSEDSHPTFINIKNFPWIYLFVLKSKNDFIMKLKTTKSILSLGTKLRNTDIFTAPRPKTITDYFSKKQTVL